MLLRLAFRPVSSARRGGILPPYLWAFGASDLFGLEGVLGFWASWVGAPRGIGRTATVSRQWLVGSVDAAVFGDAQW